MKLLEIKTPMDAITAMAGTATGCWVYLKVTLLNLDAEKFWGLLWAMLVAFATGAAAVAGKHLMQYLIRKWRGIIKPKK